MKKHIFKIIALVLLIVIFCMIFFRGQLMERFGEHQTIIETIEIKDKALEKEIAEYKEVIVPALEEKVDSLQKVVIADKKEIAGIHTTLGEVVQEIEDNDVCEDMEAYAEYLGTNDTLPKLMMINGKFMVVISREQLKASNIIFAKYNAYIQERPILLKNIKDLEGINDYYRAEVSALKHTIHLYDERITFKDEIILQKDTQIDLLMKKGRRRTWSMVGITLLAVGGTALILK